MATGRRGLLAGAASWLVDPPDAAAVAQPAPPTAARPVVAVFGLGRGCGASAIARALALALAARDPAGAAAVCCQGAPAAIPLASRPAARLAAVLADVPGASARAAGRLCLVGGAAPAALADTARHHAPLVLDAGAVEVGGAPAALADSVVIVAVPGIEPALARVVAAGIARIGREPLLVLNRVNAVAEEWAAALDLRGGVAAGGGAPGGASGKAEEWAAALDLRGGVAAGGGASGWAGAALAVPESRVAARLAAVGLDPRGGFGRALRTLADACAGGKPDHGPTR